MSEKEWHEELFYLYRLCKANSIWPKNLTDILSWIDEDAKQYLITLRTLDEKGILKIAAK